MIQIHQEIPFDVNEELKEFVKLAGEDVVRQQMAQDMRPLQKPTLNLDFGAFVILNNLPVITEDKLPKLMNVLGKVLEKSIPKDKIKEISVSLTGQGFIKLESEEFAEQTIKVINGFQLDPKHVLQAFNIKRYEQVLETTDEYTALKSKTRKELQQWLQDPRNQLSYIQEKQKLTLSWFQPLDQSLDKIVDAQTLPTFENVEWSKNGTYLVVYKGDGFQLYGGSNKLDLIYDFHHPEVKNVTFTNDEEYALSFNGTQADTASNENYILWKVREELKIKTFKAEQQDVLGTFQFSSNAQYLARIENDMMTIYEAPNFTFKDKTVLPMIQNFTWIEKSNYICYAAYHGSHRESKQTKDESKGLVILEIPTFSKLKWKSIPVEFDRCELLSNAYGKWVCTVINKRVKKKQASTLVQVANLKKKYAPLEVADAEFNEEYEQVFFEPRTGKLAIQYKDKEKSQRAIQVYHYKFFAIEEAKDINLKDMGTFHSKEFNEVLWANNGIYLAFINNVRGSPDQGKLEFGMVNRKQQETTATYSIEITKSSIHFYMTHAQWDPSGTYFVTMADQYGSVVIWSAIGEQLVRDTITKINSINWRLQPVNLLTEQLERKLNDPATQKEYIKRWEAYDDKIVNRAKHEREEKRNKLHDQFTNLLAEKKKRWRQARQERAKLLGFDADDRSKFVPIEIVEKEEVVEQQ